MSERNMFTLIERGYAGAWTKPGLDTIGPTASQLEGQRRRDILAKAKQGVLGKKRKTYYERQLEKFGFR